MCLLPRIAREFVRNADDRSREFYEFVTPAIDIVEDGNDLIITIDLPGFDKDEINMRIIENTLSINAKREVNPNLGTVYCRHRPININKKIELPISAKDYKHEKVIGKATYVDGVVTLRIPSKNRIIVT